MRRTYRSKKETSGALDHKDVLHNMDEKSSAFDAFYIQNIKHTKREMSSMLLHAGSNKVRKRKYVKRIVKDVEPIQQESALESVYLTPNKSLHVNKPLDPFDQLLNSSSSTRNHSPRSSKGAIFDRILKEGKTYSKRKLAKIKKYNYSSSISSESDKENSKNETQDTSNIKMHQLLIEKYDKESPKHFDRSINDLVQNFCVLKKSDIKSTPCGSSSSNFNRNRLTTNIQSPILQNSPLCSTPFKEKYRGQSIYNFSPIKFTSNLINSPNCMNTSDNKDNNTIRFVKGTINKFSNISENISVDNDDNNLIDEFKTISLPLTPIEREKARPADTSDNSIKSQITSETCKNVSNIFANGSNSLCDEEPVNGKSIVNITEKKIHENFEDVNVLPDSKVNSDKRVSNSSHEAELLNISIVDKDKQVSKSVHEVEFINNIPTGDKELRENYEGDNSTQYSNDKSDNQVISSIELSSLQTTELEPFLGFLENNQDTQLGKEFNPINYDSEISVNISCDGKIVSNESYIENSVDSEINESRTSLSDKSLDKSIILGKVDVKKSVEANITLNNTNDTSDTNDSELSCKVSSKAQSDDSYHDDDGSSYNTCDSGQSSQNTSELMFTKEALVVLEKMDDSLFNRYYDKIADYETDASDTSYPDSESYASFDDITSESLSNKSTNDIIENNNCGIEEHIDLNTSSEITDENDTETDSNSNTEEDICISFVTTRRRNEVTNDSMILDFSDSYDSKSSLDCDKTVLSNNKVSLQKSDLAVNMEEETLVSNSSGNETANILVVEDNAQCQNSEASVSNIMTRKSVETTESSIIVNSLEPPKFLTQETKPSIVLQPGKKWERSLSIYKRMTMMGDYFDHSILDVHLKGRKYRQSVISTMEMQDSRDSLHNDSIHSRKSFISKPCRSTIKIIKEPNSSRLSLSTTTVVEDLKGFLHEDCDDTIVELSKLSIVDSEHEVTVLENFHDTAGRVSTARDYVLRRCNQTDSILFDECYPDTVLKNCRKIGEGVYGEVFLWRAGDGRVRVMKIVPIAGTTKVNGEHQKDFHEIISEIVIAMELSALRAPIAEIERHFDEGKEIDALDLHSIQNATDIFNEVLAVRCVYGSYPSRLLDLWELFDETKGSENDNPAILPLDQQYIVLELANAGQDLESYQFNSAEQAHALFLQVAFGLAVGEEGFQFEHRDLHWGNVLIAPTDQKFATFVVRGRAHRVPRCGVAATIIDYSLSRLSLPLAATPDAAALYNDLSADDGLFDARGDYQFEVYRLMRDKLGNDWKNFEPYTNILWLHYTVDKMITALRYKRTNTKIHKHYIAKLKGIKNRILDYGSAVQFVLTDIEF